MAETSKKQREQRTIMILQKYVDKKQRTFCVRDRPDVFISAPWLPYYIYPCTPMVTCRNHHRGPLAAGWYGPPLFEARRWMEPSVLSPRHRSGTRCANDDYAAHPLASGRSRSCVGIIDDGRVSSTGCPARRCAARGGHCGAVRGGSREEDDPPPGRGLGKSRKQLPSLFPLFGRPVDAKATDVGGGVVGFGTDGGARDDLAGASRG